MDTLVPNVRSRWWANASYLTLHASHVLVLRKTEKSAVMDAPAPPSAPGEYQFIGRWMHRAAAKAKAAEEKAAAEAKKKAGAEAAAAKTPPPQPPPPPPPPASGFTSEHARWVASTFTSPSGGARYFVDLAANHPTFGSSTYDLEHLGWSGLCIEPNPMYTAMLRAQRKCTVVDTPVDSEVRSVTFQFGGNDRGGIQDDRFDNTRELVARHARTAAHTTAQMRTAPLHAVLRKAGSPKVIDYLSLDVEGAESAILGPRFRWEAFTFLAMTIERPPPDLNQRLFEHGYLFARAISHTDAAYVHSSHPEVARVADNASFVQMPAKCHTSGGAEVRYTYPDRYPLKHVHCRSIFGCCSFPDFPQSTTRYMQPLR